jgi:hypothetical protein
MLSFFFLLKLINLKFLSEKNKLVLNLRPDILQILKSFWTLKIRQLTDAIIPDNKTEVQLTIGECMLGFGVKTFRSGPFDFWN